MTSRTCSSAALAWGLTLLAAPAMGRPPVVRIAAPDGDGAAAYRRHRAVLVERFAT